MGAWRGLAIPVFGRYFNVAKISMGGVDMVAHQLAKGVDQFTVYHLIYSERGEWFCINALGGESIAPVEGNAGAVI